MMASAASADSSPVIAIELGRFESRVGVFRDGGGGGRGDGDGEVVIFPDDNLDTAIPSWVGFKKEDGERVFGRVAMELGVLHPERSICAGFLVQLLANRPKIDANKIRRLNQSVKPLDVQLQFVEILGKAGVVIEVAGQKKVFYMEQVVAMLLRHMKEIAEGRLDTETADTGVNGVIITKAVLIIPTGGLHSIRTHSLRQCAAIAGLTEVGFLSRCQAAVIWHQFYNSGEEHATTTDDDDDDDATHDDADAGAKNSSYIKVMDFDDIGTHMYATSVVDAKEDVLKEDFTSRSANDEPQCLDSLTKRLDTWVVISKGYDGAYRAHQPDCSVEVERCDEEEATIFKYRDPACIVSGAAVYAANLVRNDDSGGPKQLKPAVPRSFWLLNDADHCCRIIPKHSLFDEEQKGIIRAPIAMDGRLDLKVVEGESFGAGDEYGFLGSIKIAGFEARDREANVEVTFQVSYDNGSFDVTAKCEWSGKPCHVLFGTDWFSHSFSEEWLEALGRQELRLGAKSKKPGQDPGCSSSGGNPIMDLTVEAASGSTASGNARNTDDAISILPTPSSSQRRRSAAAEDAPTASGSGGGGGQIPSDEMGALQLVGDDE